MDGIYHNIRMSRVMIRPEFGEMVRTTYTGGLEKYSAESTREHTDHDGTVCLTSVPQTDCPRGSVERPLVLLGFVFGCLVGSPPAVGRTWSTWSWCLALVALVLGLHSLRSCVMGEMLSDEKLLRRQWQQFVTVTTVVPLAANPNLGRNAC